MTFQPHLRLTWRGTLPNGEIWSNSLGLVPDSSAFQDAIDAVDFLPSVQILQALLPDINLTDDIVTDVVNFHSRLETRIVMDCVLTRITLAAIDQNGHYAAPPREAAVNVTGGAANGQMPHQIARKVTLESDDDLGRVKGGWFIPRPSNFEFDVSTDLWSATNTSACRDSVKTFLDDLENAPGLDNNSFRVVIPSQGRHNANGSVRMPPRNCDVKRVNVGRRADVQRRRANKISEARVTDAVLADG